MHRTAEPVSTLSVNQSHTPAAAAAAVSAAGSANLPTMTSTTSTSTPKTWRPKSEPTRTEHGTASPPDQRKTARITRLTPTPSVMCGESMPNHGPLMERRKTLCRIIVALFLCRVPFANVKPTANRVRANVLMPRF
uniref:DnaJ (Hsp40) homolog, subfamily C, member 5 gamma a n=1 Tax=Nothobranchius pienaari TaxID=704102 RepID=A0A1A8QGJ6_9TELE